MREHCDNCAFGLRRWPSPDAYVVECHKHAPESIIEEIGKNETGRIGDMIMLEPIVGPAAKWPQVKRDDFCGEWEMKDAS
jgi:hypothetical protein